MSTVQTPRQFAVDGFEVIDASRKIEEESLPMYRQAAYYPMRIGGVINDRYQVVAKLGFGTSSTVWLCRDLSKMSATYWALKVNVNTIKNSHELDVWKQLDQGEDDHPGREHVRACEEAFTLTSPYGEHQVLVMTPLAMSLKRLQDLQKAGIFQQDFVNSATSQVLLGLDFLHQRDIIHSDLHADNLMIAVSDQSVLSKVEELELKDPSPRKQVGDRFIYVSRSFLGGAGPVTISDLGQARIGSDQRGNAMPVPYRAPEIILGMNWGKSIDVWSVALMAWTMLEKKDLFRVYDDESQANNDAHHLAAMTALLGPPPSEFLQRTPATSKYWSGDGLWHGPVPLPPSTTFESLITTLDGKDKRHFAHFMECCLAWEVDDRVTSFEAWFHPWLRGGELPSDDTE